ncbi:unnamed protein product [Peronospora destructor]|uniref:Transglutaminase elicitor n=1 Tax=Peronospora destructor TaxID=86335 RepID=A0AAV0V5S3_9STRA|nr:unnamed protein product [Peronospora destructor]
MVYSPTMYLVASAVAAVVLQMQQAAATSMYYDPIPICEYETFRDLTLLDLVTIPRTAVQHPELLSNKTMPPDAVYLKVGINEVLSDLTDNSNEYSYVAAKSVSNVVGFLETLSEENVKDDTAKKCATDWDEPMTTSNIGLALNEKIHTERRLEELDITEIGTLENFYGKMETTLAKLPNHGKVLKKPWPGPYWPTAKDSINTYIDPNQAPPSANICAIRTNQTSGFCIPKWWGICHAWAAASIFEEEPNCPVTYNNVTFSPLDLKGLLTYAYNSAKLSSIFAGVRFNGDDATNVKDEYGRSKSLTYDDLNPGLLHIAVANIVGNLHKSFAIDIVAGKEVWNQPVLAFKVLEKTKMSSEEAAQAFYAREKYPRNANATRNRKIKKYENSTILTYLLEMDNNGKIIGGEWLYGSLDRHPDFLWTPTKTPAADLVLPSGMRYADVSMLLKKSVACSHTK